MHRPAGGRRASRRPLCDLLSMTARLDTTPHSRGAIRPRSDLNFALLDNRGRREDRVRAAPAVSCAKLCEETHTSIQVQRKHSGLPRAMVLRLISRSPWRPGFLATIIPEKRLLLTNLTPASGRRDHTTSPSASATLVSRSLRVHRIPPHVRDDREPPLLSGETGELIALICPTG
jgi:hypothetical protein